MNGKRFDFYFTLLLFLLVSACKEEITVNVPQSSDKLVVEGYISTEADSSYVFLSKTISYYTKGPNPVVTDAFILVNNDTFFHVGYGWYKPHSPYKGIPNTNYNLKVTYNGTDYTASSFLNPLIVVDTLNFQIIHHDKELIAPDGYSVSFNFIFKDDNQFTYFRDGFKNEMTHGKDSIYGQIVTFDSKNSHYGNWQPFDVPFLRLQPNDTALLLFKSCDQNIFNLYNAIASNQQAGTPFSNPPANLPNNIRGGAIGVFAAQEVRHLRIRITP
ncbi:MAG: DUF4249 family protein [Bacteroidia bacterium]